MPTRATILGRLVIPIRVTSRGARSELKLTGAAIRDAARAQKGLERAGYRLNRTIQAQHQRFFSLQGAMALAAGSTGVGLLIRRFNAVADRMTLAESRVRLVTSTTEELRSVQESIFQIAQRSRSEYFLTTDLYARLARSTQHLHIEQSRLLTVTEAINQAAIIGGATTNEYTAGIIQLSQGFASGVLHGDELRSVLEQLPRVAQAIAAGLGVDRGQLRDIGELRELTVTRVLQAIESQADAISRDFLLVERTVEQSILQVRNTVSRGIQRANENSVITREFIAQIDELRLFLERPSVQATAIGGVQALVRGVTALATNLDVVGVTLGTYFGVRISGQIFTASRAMLRLVRRTDSFRTALLAFARGPQGALIAVAAAAATGALYMFRFKESTEEAQVAAQRLAQQSIVPGDLEATLQNLRREIGRIKGEIDAIESGRGALSEGTVLGGAVRTALDIALGYFGFRMIGITARAGANLVRGAVANRQAADALRRFSEASRRGVYSGPRRLTAAPFPVSPQRALPAPAFPVSPQRLLTGRTAITNPQRLLPAPRQPAIPRVAPAGNIFTVNPSGAVTRGLSIPQQLSQTARRSGASDLRETLGRLIGAGTPALPRAVRDLRATLDRLARTRLGGRTLFRRTPPLSSGGRDLQATLAARASASTGPRALQETLNRLAQSTAGRTAALTAVVGALTAQGVQAQEANRAAELIVAEQERQNRNIVEFSEQNQQRQEDIQRALASVGPAGTLAPSGDSATPALTDLPLLGLFESLGYDPSGRIERDRLEYLQALLTELNAASDRLVEENTRTADPRERVEALNIQQELQGATETPRIPVSPVTRLAERSQDQLRQQQDLAAQFGVTGQALSRLVAEQETHRNVVSEITTVESDLARVRQSLAIIDARRSTLVENATRTLRVQYDRLSEQIRLEDNLDDKRQLSAKRDEIAGTIAAQAAAANQQALKGEAALLNQQTELVRKLTDLRDALTDGRVEEIVQLQAETAEIKRNIELRQLEIDFTRELAETRARAAADQIERAQDEANESRESVRSAQVALDIARERLSLSSLRGGSGEETPGQQANFEFLERRLELEREVADARERFQAAVFGTDLDLDVEATAAVLASTQERLRLLGEEQGLRAQAIGTAQLQTQLQDAATAAQAAAADRIQEQQQRAIRLARTFSSTLSSGIRRAISSAETLSEVIKDIVAGLVQGIGRSAGESILRSVFSPRQQEQGTGLSLIRAVVPSQLNLPGRASGGAVYQRRAYEVGERGREIFMPGQNGTVFPISEGGGFGGPPVVNVEQVFNIQSTDGPGVRRALRAARAEFVTEAVDQALTRVGQESRRPNGRLR